MKQVNVKEFLKLPISQQILYTSVLECVKPKALLSVDIENITYFDVKIILKELKSVSPNVEMIFKKSLGITKDEYLMLPIQNFFILKKYIESFFVSLRQNEVKLLESVNADSALWVAAGGNELDVYADILPLSQLAKIYGGYPLDYGDKKYLEIITLLSINNKQGQIEVEYNRLKTNQK